MFSKSQYMVGTERYYLASRLGLSESQVKVWFQNRRIKSRKQSADTSRSDYYSNRSDFSDSCSESDISESGSV